MSYPEYKQRPEDHRSCIVLVSAIGPFNSKENFFQLWDQVNKIDLVAVTKDGRTFSPRFVLNYPVENSEWGDFQYHRKVLGLICIAQYNDQVSGEDLEKQYTDLKNLFDSTLLDTRLVILGIPHKEILVERTENHNESINGSPQTSDSLVIEPNHYTDQSNAFNKELPQYGDEELSQVLSDISDVTRRRMLGYMDCDEACRYLNHDIEYMCRSIFYVLESRRLTATNVQLKQPSILTAPFEKSGVISMDMEVKTVRNRFLARCRKQIGDLCLLVDMPNEAVVQYQAAMDLLKAASDDLWVGCALEGIAVASSLVLMTQEMSKTGGEGNMKRNSSFTGRSSPVLLLDPSLSLQNSFSHLDLASTKAKLNVTTTDVIAQYREAIACYDKYPAAAIIKMEASLKATRLLITHKKTKTAAEFLHDVAYVILDDFTYKERVERFDVIGDLYSQLNFHRKAAFFKRVAAMHCVNPLLPSPAWSECYKLLLQAFSGFNMSFIGSDYHTSEVDTGWNGIRARVFHELIFAARQLGAQPIIARHSSLRLHALYDWMGEEELIDVVQLLESCTRVEIDRGLPLTTATGQVLPPVVFTCFPLLSSFEVLKLPPHLEPHKLKKVLPSDSVFIYTPMNLKPQLSRSPSVAEYEFSWVQGTAGSVEVHLFNPLPLALKVTDICLIAEGVKFQSHPFNRTLPPKSGPCFINILCTPRQPGTFRITGYQMTLFGVVSRCLFAQLPQIKQNVFTVDVAPTLPSLLPYSDLPKSPYRVTRGDNQILNSALLQIYIGERREYSIKLKNTGCVAITKIEATLESEKHNNILGQILTLDLSHLEDSLPLLPESEMDIVIKTVGVMKHSDLPDTSLISPTHSGEVKHTTSSALIQSLIRMTCTGEEGEKMSYYKETFMAIDTVLIPSINIISQEIFNVDMDTCRVAYKVFNEGNMTLNVQSSDSVVSLKPMQSEWAHCSITKCDSTASLEECKQTIRRNSQLDWFSAERQKVGLVSFERLHWSDLELDKVRRRPFSVSGQVTKNSCSRYLVGEPIKFLYKISNISGIEYENVTFKIVVLKEVAASRVEVQENSSFIHIGQSSHLGLNFNSGECLELEHVMMLLYSGQFIVECHCVTNGKPILNIDSGIAIHVT